MIIDYEDLWVLLKVKSCLEEDRSGCSITSEYYVSNNLDRENEAWIKSPYNRLNGLLPNKYRIHSPYFIKEELWL